ncbi:uncharacterized protein LOC135397552 [Ornithodoros turicata]|uniref:uncharacterized protein LOC135397552 n=1 Tax=Ornithodoros turicata TaxID=34597 RepID=UPI003139126B
MLSRREEGARGHCPSLGPVISLAGPDDQDLRHGSKSTVLSFCYFSGQTSVVKTRSSKANICWDHKLGATFVLLKRNEYLRGALRSAVSSILRTRTMDLMSYLYLVLILATATTDNKKEDKKADVESFARFGSTGHVFKGTAKGQPVLVGVVTGPDDSMTDCDIVLGRESVDKAMKLLPPDAVSEATETQLVVPLVACTNFRRNNVKGRSYPENTWLIYPGTKWCGSGNIALHEQELGELIEVDKCCRQHDYATETINPRETKHGLTNYRGYPITTCNDDWKFYACLKKEGSPAAMEIGHIYFDMLSPLCFLKNHTTECQEYFTSHQSVCKTYGIDKSKPQTWQKVWNPTFAIATRPSGCAPMTEQRK